MSTVTIEQFKKIVEYNIDHGIKRAILGLGPSGIGKSAVSTEITQDRDMGFVDLRLLLYTETDLKGIPYPSDDKTTTKWLANDILPKATRDKDRGILLVEELTSAPKRVQAAAYQLIHDYKIGDYEVPPGWFIVALGNREDDEGVFVRMPSPLANRFEIHEIRHDLEAWKKNFAYPTGVNPMVIAYLNFKPSALHNFEAGSDSMVFASPRSWVAVSDILNTGGSVSDEVIRYKIIGNIGEIEANSFRQFCLLKDQLADAEDILRGRPFRMPTAEDQIYLLLGSVVSKLADLRETTDMDDVDLPAVKNAVRFFLRLSPEFTVVGLKDLIYLNRPLVKRIFLEEMDEDAILDFISENDYIFE